MHLMPIVPEEFDFERSRAAVAVACLQWLQCTGPAIEPELARVTSSKVVDLSRNPPPIVSPDQVPDSADLPHPLWDRWLDG
jgi:hypothetical protein